MTVSNLDIERCMIELLSRRAATASICPSDVARTLVSDEDAWRALMPCVRRVAAKLSQEERISITQGSETLTADRIDHGPIRLRRGPQF